ncbi:LysM peptidoglycan-binding domain-containing protein [Paludibacter sp.]
MLKNIRFIKYLSANLKISLIISSIFILQSCTILAQTPSYPIKNINGVDYVVYTVQAKEGFYRVSKNLNTTEEIIKKYNPATESGLKEGMEIIIPAVKQVVVNSNYIEHKVEKKQTIFSITKKYNISATELIENNPQLTDRAIQTGEILRIPISPKQQESKPSTQLKKEENKAILVDNTKHNNSVNNNNNGQPINLNINTSNQKSGKHLNIAFLLPFMVDQKVEASDKRFIEFYAGALIAINDLKEKGYNFDIYTYDVEKSDIKMMEIFQDTMLRRMNLIVGPAYSNQISLACDFARINKITTLIPFSSKIIGIETNKYVYQFNPGQEIEIQKLQSILLTEATTSNIIFADVNKLNSVDDGFYRSQALKKFMDEKELNYTTLTLDVDSLHLIRLSLNPLKENIIFFNTSRINYVNLFLKELSRLSNTVNLKFYEPYSWKSIKTDKPRSFYLSTFKTEYPEDIYDNYSNKFSSIFGWTSSSELPRYDLLGYDLINYFVMYVVENNNNKLLKYPYYEGIQSNMQFEKTVYDDGGYINNSLNHYE